MPQDDVTDPAPLRGGRQRANHIQVHRIELGLPERKMAEKVLFMKQLENGAKMVGYVGAGLGIALAAYGLYWFFDAGWNTTQKMKNALEATPLIVDEDDPWYYDVTGPMPVIGWRLVQRGLGLL